MGWVWVSVWVCSVGGTIAVARVCMVTNWSQLKVFFCSPTQTHPLICLTYTIMHVHTCLLTGSLITDCDVQPLRPARLHILLCPSSLAHCQAHETTAVLRHTRSAHCVKCISHIMSSMHAHTCHCIVHVDILEMGIILYGQKICWSRLKLPNFNIHQCYFTRNT